MNCSPTLDIGHVLFPIDSTTNKLYECFLQDVLQTLL